MLARDASVGFTAVGSSEAGSLKSQSGDLKLVKERVSERESLRVGESQSGRASEWESLTQERERERERVPEWESLRERESQESLMQERESPRVGESQSERVSEWGSLMQERERESQSWRVSE